MKEHFVFIKAGTGKAGAVEATYIHNDSIAALFKGKKEAPKVSHVRFDEDKQEWFAILRDGREIARDVKRDAVVQKEAAIINGMFAKGEFIPGGFHAKPMFDLSHVSVPGRMRYVGHHRHQYDIYICVNGGRHMVSTRDSVGNHIVITPTVMNDIVSKSEHPGIVMTPRNPEDEEALWEAERRFRIEQKIKEEESKRKCRN